MLRLKRGAFGVSRQWWVPPLLGKHFAMPPTHVCAFLYFSEFFSFSCRTNVICYACVLSCVCIPACLCAFRTTQDQGRQVQMVPFPSASLCPGSLQDWQIWDSHLPTVHLGRDPGCFPKTGWCLQEWPGPGMSSEVGPCFIFVLWPVFWHCENFYVR